MEEEQQEGADPQVEEHPERRRLLDLEGWLQFNGLRGPEEDQPDQGASHAREERARLDEESRYTSRIHRQVFGDTDAEEEIKQKQRQEFLAAMNGSEIDLRMAGGEVREGLPLRRLAEQCEYIYTLADAWDNFATEDNKRKMSFSLDAYPRDSVQELVSVLLDDGKTARDISSAALVDCCEMAHFLCADHLLKEITEILVASVDTSNCLSFCQLADKLSLTALFERSLAHMMETIGELESSEEVWDDLTPELHERIAAIKTAIESSVNDSSQSRVYFASLDEYLAIFAERVQYFRERLAEAKEQQEQSTHGTPAWYDAQKKIERQEQRVRTLEIALREQKKLFTSKRLRTE